MSNRVPLPAYNVPGLQSYLPLHDLQGIAAPSIHVRVCCQSDHQDVQQAQFKQGRIEKAAQHAFHMCNPEEGLVHPMERLTHGIKNYCMGP